MDTVVEALILDLLEWVTKPDKTYEEVIEAWHTSCPRLPVCEEVNDRGNAGSVSLFFQCLRTLC